mmetsp:Transcript_37417/g.117893  ORF Transcript_37417/g.117893 Transcript_37417/m.117893 type:complete len:431 (+) Transcript_37417:260-1552(+)
MPRAPRGTKGTASSVRMSTSVLATQRPARRSRPARTFLGTTCVSARRALAGRAKGPMRASLPPLHAQQPMEGAGSTHLSTSAARVRAPAPCRVVGRAPRASMGTPRANAWKWTGARRARGARAGAGRSAWTTPPPPPGTRARARRVWNTTRVRRRVLISSTLVSPLASRMRRLGCRSRASSWRRAWGRPAAPAPPPPASPGMARYALPPPRAPPLRASWGAMALPPPAPTPPPPLPATSAAPARAGTRGTGRAPAATSTSARQGGRGLRPAAPGRRAPTLWGGSTARPSHATRALLPARKVTAGATRWRPAAKGRSTQRALASQARGGCRPAGLAPRGMAVQGMGSAWISMGARQIRVLPTPWPLPWRRGARTPPRSASQARAAPPRARPRPQSSAAARAPWASEGTASLATSARLGWRSRPPRPTRRAA